MANSRSGAKDGTPPLPKRRSHGNLDKIGCSAVLVLAGLFALGIYYGRPQHSGYSSRTDVVGTTSDSTSSPLERATERRGPPEPFKPKTVEHLVVNPDDSYSTVVQKSREDGFRELIELAKTATQEEMWIYTPSTKTWYETGYDAQTVAGFTNGGSRDYGNVTIRPDNNFIDSLIKYYPDIENIHIHPRHQTSTQEEASALAIFEAAPSLSDLVLHLRGVVKQGKTNSKGKYYVSYVVSQLGVTKYELTQTGINKYRGIYGRSGSEKVTEIFKNDLGPDVSLDPTHPDFDKEEYQIKEIERICRGLTSTYLSVTFTPHTAFEHKE